MSSPPSAATEAVARAICWETNGKDNDCFSSCLAAGSCKGRISPSEEREARAAIAAIAALATRPSDDALAEAEAKCRGADEAATFCIETLASTLGVTDYEQCDGTEEWEGDVSGTIYNVLVAAKVIDPEDNAVARHDDALAERLAAQQAEIERLREALELFAAMQTVAELLDAGSPTWASVTPKRRIEIMGERKRERDEAIICARATLAHGMQRSELMALACRHCHCLTFAQVDEEKPDGSFGPGNLERCVNCKRVRTYQQDAPDDQ